MYCRSSFRTRADARRAVVGSVEGYHDRRRPHPSIGYRIPADVMGAFFDRFDQATRGVATAA